MKRFLIIFSLAIITALTGCVNELSQETVGNRERTFTISLINNGEKTRTPGDDLYNENRIEKVDIIFFDQWGGQIYHPTPEQAEYATDKIILSIPNNEALLLFNRNIVIYMVANCELPYSAFAGKSYGEIQNLIYENSATLSPTPFEAQSSFLMEGYTTATRLDETQSNLGTVVLKRAAAKIAVNISTAQVDGYTATEASVRINNYLDKTVLSNGGTPYSPSADDFKHSAYRQFRPSTEAGVMYESDPFYSYANNWQSDPLQETYVTIRIKWRNDETATERYYYYRISFDYISALQDGQPNYSLSRNHIYTFNVDIGILGGLDPDDTLDLKPDFMLRDWTTYDILAELNQYDYLVVAEHYVEMYDISRRLIHYSASRPISIVLDEAYYYKYLSSGAIQRIDLTEADGGFYPTITPDHVTNNIVVDCNVPINYVPTYMRFTVYNGELHQEVRVVLYPRQFITSEFSNLSDIDFGYYTSIGQPNFWENSGNGRPSQNMTNFNLYTITTTSVSPEDNFVLGGDMLTTMSVFPYGNRVVTKTDAVTNNMISPKFVVASQRGIVSQIAYGPAQYRCAIYSEGGYPVGTWRIPTTAEMALISKLQNDTYSAITGLFVPSGDNSNSGRWWAAQFETVGTSKVYYCYNIGQGRVETSTIPSGGIEPRYAVRCVHDVWKDQ